MTHFARANEYVGCDLQGQLGGGVAIEGFDGAQQFAELVRLQNRGVVAGLGRQQGAGEDGGGVGIAPPGRCAIAEHAAGK